MLGWPESADSPGGGGEGDGAGLWAGDEAALAETAPDDDDDEDEEEPSGGGDIAGDCGRILDGGGPYKESLLRQLLGVPVCELAFRPCDLELAATARPCPHGTS